MTIGAALAALVIQVRSAAAEELEDDSSWCGTRQLSPPLVPSTPQPPVLLDGHVVPPHFEGGAWRSAELILRLGPDSSGLGSDLPGHYVVERLSGDAPYALERAWHDYYRPSADGIVAIPLDAAEVPSFGVALRVREISGLPSNPIWIDHAPTGVRHGDDSQRAVFVVFALVLGLLAAGFRAARDPDARIRLAVAAALAGTVVLLATAGVPWLHSLSAQVDCVLGNESVCAAPPLASLDGRGVGIALFEFERWRAGAAAIRMGQLMVFALLLPALIWLLVEPRTRPAQATCVVGASVAGFTFLAIGFFHSTMPSWMVAEAYAAFDLGLLASGAIVVAAIAVVRQTFALQGDEPPRAIARRTPRV